MEIGVSPLDLNTLENTARRAARDYDALLRSNTRGKRLIAARDLSVAADNLLAAARRGGK